MSLALHGGCEVGKTLLCCLAVLIGNVVRSMTDNRKLVWMKIPWQDMMVRRRTQLDMLGTRDRDCGRLGLDVVPSREDGLQWQRALPLGL